MNDLPSIDHISLSPIVDIHAIDSLETPFNTDHGQKENGFFVLSNDGKIYRIHFRSVLTAKKHHEQQSLMPCFPQYVNTLLSKE